MDPKDINKTAIITQFCLFEYLYMPSRMKNSAQAVQRLMDQIFKDLPYTYVFLDDILVTSRTKLEHRRHLREVFTLLGASGMAINASKSVFGQTSVKYLGQ